jgi:hypothetical protein
MSAHGMEGLGRLGATSPLHDDCAARLGPTSARLSPFPFASACRDAHPTTPEPRPSKRARGDACPLAADDYKNGVMLAPIVRSGARAWSFPMRRSVWRA